MLICKLFENQEVNNWDVKFKSIYFNKARKNVLRNKITLMVHGGCITLMYFFSKNLGVRNFLEIKVNV